MNGHAPEFEKMVGEYTHPARGDGGLEMGETILVPVMMFGWIPVVMGIFYYFPARRATIISFLIAFLFLPVASYHIDGVPSYTKMSATCCGVLLAAIVFDANRMTNLAFCPHIIDLPMILFCVCPIFTAMANEPDLTAHDGFSWMFEQSVTWGLPYLIGRIYLGSFKGLEDLAKAVFFGGLLYVPLCLYEIRFSPQLHHFLYGSFPAPVDQQYRGGLYRPMVFMAHGLQVGLFMTAASLSGFWLWYTGALREVRRMPIMALLIPLWITTLLCQSAGALVFLVLGIISLVLTKLLRTPAVILALLMLPPVYCMLRTSQWDTKSVGEAAVTFAGPVRAQSLEYRLENEQGITARAVERPWFGWGGYGRVFVLDEWGHCRFTPDSLWIIAFGTYGYVGLSALLLLLLPVGIVRLRLTALEWCSAPAAGVAICSMLMLFFAMDNLLNNMPSPIYLLGLGGIASLACKRSIADVERGGLELGPTAQTMHWQPASGF
jgi:hypothetical protein